MKGMLAGYSIAVLFSVVLHLIVVGALLVSWQPSTKKIVVQPQYLKAELVQLTAVKKSVEPVAKKPSVDKAAERRELEKRRIAEQKRAEKQRIAKLKAERQAQDKAEQERKAREQQQRQEELERQRLQAERTEKLRAEQAQATAEADRQTADSFLQAIQSRLSRYWSRPPSARRGMETLIELRLVPTGRIVGVKIVKHSGDPAFDRSVEQAALKAAPFTELQSMEPRIFEQYFRTVKVAFNPEDLRL
jgi:colicin import membrane protein